MIGLDTTFIIDFLNGDADAVRKGQELDGRQLVTTQINLFEVLTGLFLRKVRGAGDLQATLAFFERVGILSHQNEGSLQAAELLAASYKSGKALAATDALIAGILLSSGCSRIVTRDSDFRRIEGMQVLGY